MKKYQLKTPVEATMTRERVLIYRDSVSEELVMPREVFDDLFVEVTEETPVVAEREND